MVANGEIGREKVVYRHLVWSEVTHYQAAVVGICGNALRNRTHKAVHGVSAIARCSQVIRHVLPLVGRIEAKWQIIGVVIVKRLEKLAAVRIGEFRKPSGVL